MKKEIVIISMSQELWDRVEKEVEQLGITPTDYAHYVIETLLRLGYSEILEKELFRIMEEEV